MAALIKRERAERDRQLRRHVKTWVQACVQGGRGARRVHWTLRKSFVTRMRSGFFCREGSTNFKSTNYFRRPSVLHLKSSFNYCCCCRQLAVEQVSQYTWFFFVDDDDMLLCGRMERRATCRRRRQAANVQLKKMCWTNRDFWLLFW